MGRVETQTHVVTFLIDESGVLTLSGDFDLSRLGYAQGFYDGQSLFKLSSGNPDVINAIQKAFKGEHVSSETTSNGQIFLNTFSPLTETSGKVKRVIGVSSDITENKRADETIKKSELRFRKLFDFASDAIFTMDNKTFIDCNEATLNIFQCTRDQIVGQTPYRFSPMMQPDGRSSEVAAMEKIGAALGGKSQFFEWRHIRYDGTPFDAEVSLNRLDIDDNVFIQAMVRDVSERKRAEEENKRLAMVANTTTNSVVLTDGDGKIEWVNPSFTRITGYTLEEVQGKKPGDFLTGPQTDRRTSEFMEKKIREGEGFKDVEILNYTREGIPYWILIEVQPIRDKNGKAVQFIAIESDITDRKATQQALMERHEELIKINAELDRFVYSASHDLRAPIASLLGLIEIAKLEKDKSGIDQLLEMQKKSLLRMDRFINDIVDHSRNTRLIVESESVSFESIVNAALEQLQFMDNFTRIKKFIRIHQPNVFQTSPTRLEILFNNLVSNAIKYADVRKAEPFLDIEVNCTADHATIKVKDNGEGIPEHAKAKIFDMFYRASGKGTGSGLGLYIVKEAIQKIGGTIQVNSEYGSGTEFIVDIPNLKNHS